MNLKYVTFQSLTVFVFAYAVYFQDAFWLLWQYEKTHISLMIIAIYIMSSVYLGFAGEKSNFKAVNFQRLELTSLGLLGTVIGILLMFSHAGDAAAFKAHVISELSSIFICTGLGVGLAWLLGQQMAICFGRHE